MRFTEEKSNNSDESEVEVIQKFVVNLILV